MGFWEVVVLRERVFHPEEPFLQRWNKVFMLMCSIAVALDPLFFYVPGIDETRKCLRLSLTLEKVVIILRSIVDMFYIIRVVFQFRTGFSAFSTGTLESTVVIEDSWKIARRYLLSYFLIDILAAVPLPQVFILLIIPRMEGPRVLNTLKFVVLLQFVPRFFRCYLLYKETMKSHRGHSRNGQFTIILYLHAAHVLGALWYLFSIEREMDCWQEACFVHGDCDQKKLYCSGYFGDEAKPNDHGFLDIRCPADLQDRSLFDFGVFIDAHNSGILKSTSLPQKFFYCFWWALQNLSTLGQNLKTSTRIMEICFAVSNFVVGLVLFSYVIGIIQATMLTSTIRAEEMKMKWLDVEHWMDTNFFPPTLRKRIRRHDQYKWQKAKGLDVENLLLNFPKHLRRDIKRHLCLNLLSRVPIFKYLGEEVLDEVCESLKPVFYTEGSYIVREGEPVEEMLFIKRGKLLTMTANGGRTGFFDSEYFKDGDFCGVGVLTWALDPRSSSSLPISTRTVQTLTEVEAYALMADDLKFVASQFRQLLSKQFHHAFRFYSLQWRTWAACFIQAAWRQYSKKKLENFLRRQQDRLQDALAMGTR